MTAAQKRDLQLVREVLAGKHSVFAMLVARCQKRISALGMSFFHNASDTEDFVQDVFLKAFTKLGSFRGESSFETWLTRIAYTTAVNAKNRRHEYEHISDEDLLPSKGDNPENAEIRRITQEAVREAVAQLPERYALCLDLYFFYDTPYDEIAIITGLPMNTIKSHIFRAKKILRDKLEDYT
ncbi:MAG: sigma-70 family RNA polymerase sigma factor [Treponema sp.]|nr:sigma-70 family RNA polymerase sigma factor [Treponema sp.]